MDLYLKNGEKAGLYDVAKWWIATYPRDIFIGLTGEVATLVRVRNEMDKILAMRDAAKKKG
jgi:hypothetical protein